MQFPFVSQMTDVYYSYPLIIVISPIGKECSVVTKYQSWESTFRGLLSFIPCIYRPCVNANKTVSWERLVYVPSHLVACRFFGTIYDILYSCRKCSPLLVCLLFGRYHCTTSILYDKVKILCPERMRQVIGHIKHTAP